MPLALANLEDLTDTRESTCKANEYVWLWPTIHDMAAPQKSVLRRIKKTRLSCYGHISGHNSISRTEHIVMAKYLNYPFMHPNGHLGRRMDDVDDIRHSLLLSYMGDSLCLL